MCMRLPCCGLRESAPIETRLVGLLFREITAMFFLSVHLSPDMTFLSNGLPSMCSGDEYEFDEKIRF